MVNIETFKSTLRHSASMTQTKNFYMKRVNIEAKGLKDKAQQVHRKFIGKRSKSKILSNVSIDKVKERYVP